MDNALFYCAEKVAPVGSPLYYASSSLSESVRANMLALLTFAHEVHDIALNCREPAVALAKLHFWHEEVGRAWRHEARHPVFKALNISLQDLPIAQKEWFELLHAEQIRISHPEYSRASYWQQAYAVWSWLMRLSNSNLGLEEQGLAENLPRYFGRVDALLYESTEGDRMEPNLDAHYALLQETIALGDDCLACLPSNQRLAHRQVLTMVTIWQHRLARALKRWSEIGINIPHTSPLRSFWIARRCFKDFLRSF